LCHRDPPIIGTFACTSTETTWEAEAAPAQHLGGGHRAQRNPTATSPFWRQVISG
jgi:hypothetical protein